MNYSQSKPYDVIWNQNYGHIGTGLPYATGALLADQAETGKQRPSMLLTSDSSFLFHIGEFVTQAQDIGPAIDRAYERGGVTVIHVPIDPKANSEEMPKYERFRTWYAEGTQ